jgi:two-component system nitrate/nitrite sensor histidine kinase NarX
MEGDGLVPTLEKTAQEFSQRSGVAITVESKLSGVKLSSNEELHVMQIVREALANVIHHAKASHAWVLIKQSADNMISVSIDDDGIGLAHNTPEPNHYGMAIMLERAKTLNGILHTQTRATGGTRIKLLFRPAQSIIPIYQASTQTAT